MSEDAEITIWLDRIRSGDAEAVNLLAKVLYERLYTRAQSATNHLDRDGSLNASILVHEVFVKLLAARTFERAENRIYLYAAAARAMREVLADYYAKRSALKRRSPGVRLLLDDILDHFERQDVNFLELSEALVELEQKEPRKAAVIQARYFLGDSMKEAAQRLGISLSTAESDMRTARLWLYRRLR